VSSKQATVSSLAMATPVGKRAVSITVDSNSSLMGMIRPGDYVDVIGVIPVPALTADGKQATQAAVMPLFQNILVLAVGRDLGASAYAGDSRYRKEGDTSSSSSGSLITLALSPQEASLVAFAQDQSKIRLTLRSPADSRIEQVQPATWDTLLQYAIPQLNQAKGQTAEQQVVTPALPKEKPKEVEVYRGLKKEVITLSK